MKTYIKLFILNLSTIVALINYESSGQPAGNSLLLNGVSNFVNVPDNSYLDFKDSLSIEFWLNPTDTSLGVILSKGICQNDNYGYYVSVDTGKVIFQWNPNGSCQGNIANYAITDNPVIVPFQCTHVGIVFDTSSTSIYINGVAVPTSVFKPNNTPIHNSSEPLRIGVYRKVNPVGFAAHYAGELDEVRMWNYKLSSTEINNRMNTNLNGNEPGLVAYYDMEEPGSGNGMLVPNRCITTGSILDGVAVGDTLSPSHIPRCSTVGLYEENNPETKFLELFPNPANEFIIIKSKENQLISGKIEMFNVYGQKIVDQTIIQKSNVMIDINKWNSGVYIFSFSYLNSKFVRRFIKY